jgi:ATP-binding cassette, subfamily B, bacterial
MTSTPHTYPLTLKDILVQHIRPVLMLVFLAVTANVLALFFPKIIALGVDTYTNGTFSIRYISQLFIGLAVLVLISTFLQSIAEVYVSEKAARALRSALMDKISKQSYVYTQQKTTAVLLTTLTSDVQAIKQFIGSSLPSLIAAVCTLIGASVLILTTNWKLGLGVLSIIPLIGIAFYVVFSKMGSLFAVTQSITDKLNTVINTTIIGAALVRVLHSGRVEFGKFVAINTLAKENGTKILMLFASLIPVVMFASSMAALIILYIGGNFVIQGTISLGEFVAFNSYISILLFPIFIIGFTTSSIGQGIASMARIRTVLSLPEQEGQTSTQIASLTGAIDVSHVSLTMGEKKVLQDVSFSIAPRTRIAIIGPTASGKSQLLAILAGLVAPTSGAVTYDGQLISAYTPESFYAHVGIVFQDSILFNVSIRDNIAFGSGVTDTYLEKAIRTAELTDFIAELPQGLDTVVSERGLTLSGGQKQRIMLARALASHPRILLLDDFTARVDTLTEKKILAHLQTEYPSMTVISITQKISTIDQYERIIVLARGEVIGVGTHAELMATTPEYVQMYESQKSTTHYEQPRISVA